MSESKTKETASRLSLSASWWAGVLPCLARPLSLSCHATTIAQLDVSVCLIFKRVALCPCAPCCLAPGLPRPSAASLALRAVWLGLLCVVCVPGLLCLPAVCLALCSCLLACPASLRLCCLSLPWLLCGLVCPGYPCLLLSWPAVLSICPCPGYPSEGEPYIFLGVYPVPPTGVLPLQAHALTHGLLLFPAVSFRLCRAAATVSSCCLVHCWFPQPSLYKSPDVPSFYFPEKIS